MELQRMCGDIQEVLKATEKLMEHGGYEGNWRDLVVNPLLGLAIGHFGLKKQILVSNVYVIINQDYNTAIVSPANMT